MVKYRDGETILRALAEPLRLRMVKRLARGGAMSLSKMSEPFCISLPAALKHMNTLQRSGVIRTHKKGRVRICSLNPHALDELSLWLASGAKHWKLKS